MFTPIQAIQPMDTALLGKIEKPIEKEQGMFADIFQAAIENVVQTDAEKNHTEYLLATGQLDNPAEMTNAISKAQTSVDLLVQLRNKSLEAYSELMRISI